MLERRKRIVPLLLALVALAVALLVLPRGEEEEPPAPQPAQTGAQAQKKPARARPRVPVVVIEDGRPKDGVQRIRVKEGERVRFTVTSDAPHHIHLHGYDLSKHVKRGRRATFSFRANSPGGFEVEIEELGRQIAKLEVRP